MSTAPRCLLVKTYTAVLRTVFDFESTSASGDGGSFHGPGSPVARRGPRRPWSRAVRRRLPHTSEGAAWLAVSARGDRHKRPQPAEATRSGLPRLLDEDEVEQVAAEAIGLGWFLAHLQRAAADLLRAPLLARAAAEDGHSVFRPCGCRFLGFDRDGDGPRPLIDDEVDDRIDGVVGVSMSTSRCRRPDSPP